MFSIAKRQRTMATKAGLSPPHHLVSLVGFTFLQSCSLGHQPSHITSHAVLTRSYIQDKRPLYDIYVKGSPEKASNACLNG